MTDEEFNTYVAPSLSSSPHPSSDCPLPYSLTPAGDGHSKWERVILLTGGCGFIGSHVVNLLVNKYPAYKVICFDKLDYCASLKNISPSIGKPNFKFVKGDILSLDLVLYVIHSERVDTIMHFAAQSHVDNSFGNSIHFTKTNVLGTHVLCEAALKSNLRLFLHVSTDEVYGEILQGRDDANEETVLEPTNPYASSKAGAEFVVKSYFRSFHLPVIITRGNNVYGPGQYPEKIIPKFIHLLQRGKPLPLHGDGSHSRHFLYVEDCACAFDIILHKGTVGEVYNIGTQSEISNNQVALDLLSIFQLSDKEKEMVTYVEDRKFNDTRYAIDSEKVKQLGWKPRVGWMEGLRRTVDFFNNVPDYWPQPEEALQAHPNIKL
mmetsp:Transcript_36093/g.90572  ORF Transcript_36093/g.90572 Transcript_36093/m.90572 type:complete len:377 (+) Transcript_36093:114-1244(+)